MYFLVASGVFALAGASLIVAKDQIIDKTSKNDMIQRVYSNSMYIAIACFILAIYLYTLHKPQNTSYKPITETTTQTTVSDNTPPSYDQATSSYNSNSNV